MKEHYSVDKASWRSTGAGEQLPVVSISCITYNQKDYIQDALDSFLDQETDFPFEILVHDDCSTDGTTEIIREYEKRYPDIVKPMYEEINQYLNFGTGGTLEWNLPRARGKYLAMCEGDDFWVDNRKLQKQVDFLEKNPEYGMCYTDFNILYQTTGVLEKSLFTTDPVRYRREYPSPEAWVIRNGYVAPPSWLMRISAMPKDRIPTNDGTFVIFTHFLATSKVKCLPFVSATYRILEESAAHSKSYERMYQRMKTLLEVKFRLIDYYGLKEETRAASIDKYYRTGLLQFVIHDKHEDVKEARKTLHPIGLKEKALFMAEDLRLNGLVRLAYKIVKGK